MIEVRAALSVCEKVMSPPVTVSVPSAVAGSVMSLLHRST